jgi:hypothetical protein
LGERTVGVVVLYCSCLLSLRFFLVIFVSASTIVVRLAAVLATVTEIDMSATVLATVTEIDTVAALVTDFFFVLGFKLVERQICIGHY